MIHLRSLDGPSIRETALENRNAEEEELTMGKEIGRLDAMCIR
jgi:hypothetical protein